MANEALNDLLSLMRSGRAPHRQGSRDRAASNTYQSGWCYRKDEPQLESPLRDRPLDEYDRQLLYSSSPDRVWPSRSESPRSSQQQQQHQQHYANPPGRPVPFGASYDSDERSSYHLHEADNPPFRQVRVRAPLHLHQPAEAVRRQCATSSSSPFFAAASSSAAQAEIIGPILEEHEKRDDQSLSSTDGHKLLDAATRHHSPIDTSPYERERSEIRLLTQRITLASTPTVQGIRLVPTSSLPDRLQSLFPYPLFNAMQSKCFESVYNLNTNFAMSAPTGSGKTALLELAICKLVIDSPDRQFKAVYLAPTKALCAERASDWSVRFRLLGLTCSEITGDTAVPDSIPKMQDANIIVTTPEKWDSVTRKWKDHRQLMLLVKLVLIDEVHILGDTRGATLEVIVSRMKSIGGAVRFVALSATIPNIADVAEWLGRDPQNPRLPADLSIFGEEFRPVRLERHVFEIQETGSGFTVDSNCTKHIPNIISRYSKGQPILVFCFTKKSCEATAQLLRDHRQRDPMAEDWWPKPTEPLQADSPEVTGLYAEGIAIHHGDLHMEERTAIESGFLGGQISLICCTSTLAIGVNLPCHMVIVKNTVTCSEEGLREYTGLEIMQMLGRAGRPQFQSSGAVAIIMTQTAKLDKYRRLVAGQEVIESKLHLNLIEHLNAEIGLGTISDLAAAQAWLEGTFLHARLRQNPHHYKLGKLQRADTLQARVGAICRRDVDALVRGRLVGRSDDGSLKCTPFGEAMARYYVRFASMKTLLGLGQGSTMSEILEALTQAEEYSAIRFRQSEATKYSPYLSKSELRFPVGDISTRAQKIFVIVQIELGKLHLPKDHRTNRPDRQHLQDRITIFNSIHRLVRCVIDCQIYLCDGLAVRNGLELARSFSCMMWDDSASQLQLVPGIGPVISRKLISAGIKTIEALANSDLARVAMLTGKKTAAEKFYQEARSHPMPVIAAQIEKQEIGNHVCTVFIKIQVGFRNRRVPEVYGKHTNYVCVVCETSDHEIVDFRRMKAAKAVEPIFVKATLTRADQSITCFVVCEDLIGTFRTCQLKPEPWLATISDNIGAHSDIDKPDRLRTPMNSSKKRSRSQIGLDWDTDEEETADFADLTHVDDLDEADLLAAERGAQYTPIEQVESPGPTGMNQLDRPDDGRDKLAGGDRNQKRSDGRYECKHRCKDKTSCRHLCCREGLDKPPRRKISAKTRVNEYDGKWGRQTNDFDAMKSKPQGVAVVPLRRA